MKPFRKRNPLPIGAAGLAILLLLVAASLNIRDLPLIGQGPTYSARFSVPPKKVRAGTLRIASSTPSSRPSSRRSSTGTTNRP